MNQLLNNPRITCRQKPVRYRRSDCVRRRTINAIKAMDKILKELRAAIHAATPEVVALARQEQPTHQSTRLTLDQARQSLLEAGRPMREWAAAQFESAPDDQLPHTEVRVIRNDMTFEFMRRTYFAAGVTGATAGAAIAVKAHKDGCLICVLPPRPTRYGSKKSLISLTDWLAILQSQPLDSAIHSGPDAAPLPSDSHPEQPLQAQDLFAEQTYLQPIDLAPIPAQSLRHSE